MEREWTIDADVKLTLYYNIITTQLSVRESGMGGEIDKEYTSNNFLYVSSCDE